MKKILILTLIFIILISGCQEQAIQKKECSKDSDCTISGCNSEVCAKEKMNSICVAKPEFECYKSAKCKCIENKCGWEQTQELQTCLEEKSS